MTTSVPKVKVRGVCWTLFHYTDDDIKTIQEYAKSDCEYLIYGKEICPTTGTPHLQGYHYWPNPRSYPNKKFRALLNLEKRGRDCIANGTPAQNRTYCSEDGDFWEYGDLPTQGARTDWATAIESLKTDDVVAVIEAQPQLAPCIRALERFKSLTLKPLKRDVEVIVLIGATGTGKSSWAYDNYPDLYAKPDGQWFDGYAGQKTILLDDYYGSIAYPVLLKVCDRYPFNAPVKGGYIWAQWDRVIITSNSAMESWYPAIPDISAFKRRIKYLDEDYNNARKIDWTSPAGGCVLQEATNCKEAASQTVKDSK